MSVVFSISRETDMAMAFYAIAAILLIFLGCLLTGNYSSFTVIFLVFSAFYSLSGSIAARYGAGIPSIFPKPYLVDEFLIPNSLAVVGMAVGLVLVAGIKSPSISPTKLAPPWNTRNLFLLACAFAAMASIMEIVNFSRIGGLETLYRGKALYESAISDLTGDLPSMMVLLLSTAFLGLALSTSDTPRRIWARYIAIWLLCCMPLLLITAVLGDRRELLSIIVIFTVGYFYFSPIKRISFKWMTLILLVYLIMGFLFGIRGPLGDVLPTRDFSLLWNTISKPIFWMTNLNPASNEFSAPFGNFNTYILSSSDHLRWGETYLRGLTIPIPHLIWPDKPQTISLDFRDTYFPDLKKRGITGGTAYSSVLEAYINFGTFGVPIVYFLIALAIGYLERIRSKSRSMTLALFYLLLLPRAIVFFRSDLGMPVFWPLLLAFSGSWSYKLIALVSQQHIIKKKGRS